MINIETLIQLKAFARQDGAFLALLWIASFAFVVSATGGALGNLLMLATPFFVAWRLAKFRNYALDGIISFRRSLAYCLYTFLYAAILFAAAQFVYFRFLDNGDFARMFTDIINALIPVYEQSGISKSELQQTSQLISMLTPVEWVLVFLTQNLLLCLVASLPIAAVCARSANRRPNVESRNQTHQS